MLLTWRVRWTSSRGQRDFVNWDKFRLLRDLAGGVHRPSAISLFLFYIQLPYCHIHIVTWQFFLFIKASQQFVRYSRAKNYWCFFLRHLSNMSAFFIRCFGWLVGRLDCKLSFFSAVAFKQYEFIEARSKNSSNMNCWHFLVRGLQFLCSFLY